MSAYLMGIDIGLTKIKVGIVSERGNLVTIKGCKPLIKQQCPGYSEREPHVFWGCVKAAAGEALTASRIPAEKIEAVGVCGHGDGLFILDGKKQPLRNAILSIDERAHPIIKQWMDQGIYRQMALYGFSIRLGNPLPLLAWIKRYEPDNYRKMRWLIFAKDWIRLKLTGELCTDQTDASAILLKEELSEKAYDFLRQCQMDEVREKVPPIIDGDKICGQVTTWAAEETGLKAGTPVAAGFHDMSASALGSGCLSDGDVYINLGTWGTNAIIRKKPLTDEKGRLLLRAYALPNYWMLTASTPGSTSSLDWFLQNFCMFKKQEEEDEEALYTHCDKEVAKIEPGSSGVICHPYLYGSNVDEGRQAGFFGIRGLHEKAHLVRAIYEGVAFNHRRQIEILKETGAFRSIRLSGGGARSPEWSQIFADVLDMEILIPAQETGVRGAVIAASIGKGICRDYAEGVCHFHRIVRTHIPLKESVIKYEKQYRFFLKSIEVLSQLWSQKST